MEWKIIPLGNFFIWVQALSPLVVWFCPCIKLFCHCSAPGVQETEKLIEWFQRGQHFGFGVLAESETTAVQSPEFISSLCSYSVFKILSSIFFKKSSYSGFVVCPWSLRWQEGGAAVPVSLLRGCTLARWQCPTGLFLAFFMDFFVSFSKTHWILSCLCKIRCSLPSWARNFHSFWHKCPLFKNT